MSFPPRFALSQTISATQKSFSCYGGGTVFLLDNILARNKAGPQIDCEAPAARALEGFARRQNSKDYQTHHPAEVQPAACPQTLPRPP